jgi:SAM-dependent methyltransferase
MTLIHSEKIDPLRQASFNGAAENYAQSRPGYPEEVFNVLEKQAGLSPSSSILEVGCGPGQATLPLARRGYGVTTLDIGVNLVALCRERTKAYPKVRVLLSSFEAFQEAPGTFDVVLFASSFHWMDPKLKISKTHQLLKSGGHLALLGNAQPPDEGEFFTRLQAVYREKTPRLARKSLSSSEAKEEWLAHIAELEDSAWLEGHFHPAKVFRHPWTRTFTAEEYVQLLDTYSDHLVLPETEKRPLYEGIRGLIEELGGQIQKPYFSELILAQKK